MKFGEHLTDNKVQEWKSMYLDYDKLKKMIKSIESMQISSSITTEKGTSLSVPRPTNAAGIPFESKGEATQEMFFNFLDQEMRKIDQFTKKMVKLFWKRFYVFYLYRN